MKKLIFFCLAFSIILPIFGQTKNEKIKVDLLGTFHFGATSDRNSTSFKDLFSQKRQNELDTIANYLKDLKVDKFFLETNYTRQKRIDSEFKLYKLGQLTDTNTLRDEQIQIAFRTAKLNNAKLVAADFKQELPYAALQAYDELHKKDTVNPYPFFDVKYPFTEKKPKLSESTLSDYYVFMNNLYSRKQIMFDYIHYALSSGDGDNFVGEGLAASWEDRNLKIFTNILRGLDPKTDKIIVVLFGAAHTAVLRHYFEDHPYFEIVELDAVFKK